MTGCCAVGCSNDSEKGVRLFRFPKDPVRRKEWAIKVKRDKWAPTDNSRLCEVHFTPDSFELNRQDGKKPMKWNAVPTIFNYVKPKKQRKSPVKRTTMTAESGALEIPSEDFILPPSNASLYLVPSFETFSMSLSPLPLQVGPCMDT